MVLIYSQMPSKMLVMQIVKLRLLVGFILYCCSINTVLSSPKVPAIEQPNEKFFTLALLDFPPESYIDSRSGECVGFAVELTRRILVQYDYKLVAICAPAIRVYRMLQSGEVDLTINIRSTTAIKDHVDFISPQFAELELIFLSHKEQGFENMISAIRGFDYHGHRKSLVDKGFVFQDMPGSIDAIKMFVKGRSRHLLTYKAPYQFYIARNGFNMPEYDDIEYLQEIPTFYAISKASAKHDELHQLLTQHAKKTQINKFSELLPFF